MDVRTNGSLTMTKGEKGRGGYTENILCFRKPLTARGAIKMSAQTEEKTWGTDRRVGKGKRGSIDSNKK